MSHARAPRFSATGYVHNSHINFGVSISTYGTRTNEDPEMPVPQNPEKGEFVTATQPFSPPPHFRDDRVEKDMWGMTPLDMLHCRIEFKKMRYEGHFTPPMRGGGGYGQREDSWGGTFVKTIGRWSAVRTGSGCVSWARRPPLVCSMVVAVIRRSVPPSSGRDTLGHRCG